KTPGFTGYVFVTMGGIQDDRTMTEWINYWSSEDWLTNTNNYFPANGSKDLGTSGSVVYSFDTNFGEDGVMIREAFLDAEGRVTTVSIRTTPRNVAQVYSDVMNNLYIDGELIEPSWTTSELDEM